MLQTLSLYSPIPNSLVFLQLHLYLKPVPAPTHKPTDPRAKSRKRTDRDIDQYAYGLPRYCEQALNSPRIARVLIKGQSHAMGYASVPLRVGPRLRPRDDHSSRETCQGCEAGLWGCF